jgi:hypothetical protein
MYLTEPQKTAVSLLRSYRCLRVNQLEQLLLMAHGKEDTHADRQVARLPLICSHLFCKPAQDLIAVREAAPDSEMLAAMDVMLEFRNDGLEDYRPGRPPSKLVFFKNNPKGELRAYYVTPVPIGAESRVARDMLDAYNGTGNAVIFILKDLRQSDMINFPYEHYYAVNNAGKYAFYKGQLTDNN